MDFFFFLFFFCFLSSLNIERFNSREKRNRSGSGLELLPRLVSLNIIRLNFESKRN